MLKFATVRENPYGPDYLGSVACFDHEGRWIAVCPINPRELEDENFEPLTVQEVARMLSSNEIDEERLQAWVGNPQIWHCWDVLIQVNEPDMLKRAIASAYNALLLAERMCFPKETFPPDLHLKPTD